jgi:lipopolysaccharide export LptBFGC system permease protein LptF
MNILLSRKNLLVAPLLVATSIVAAGTSLMAVPQAAKADTTNLNQAGYGTEYADLQITTPERRYNRDDNSNDNRFNNNRNDNFNNNDNNNNDNRFNNNRNDTFNDNDNRFNNNRDRRDDGRQDYNGQRDDGQDGVRLKIGI